MIESEPVMFAGRKAGLARLHQYVLERGRDEGLVFSGREGMGKTALLQQFDRLFDEFSIGVYLPLDDVPADETAWWLLVAQQITAVLGERGFALQRLASVQPPEGDTRGWFAAQFIPELLSILRPHRQLILLIDDAHRLVRAVEARQLPDDIASVLRDLLVVQPQLGIVLTVDEDDDVDLAHLSPLVRLNSVVRLLLLEADESAVFLALSERRYTFAAEAQAAAYRAAGGDPILLQVLSDQLFRRWQSQPARTTLTDDDVRAVLPAVYTDARVQALMRRVWGLLHLNERLVLTALSGLVFADPLRAVDTAALETWLVETDYPLDRTAINAALRSLEYREVIRLSPQGIAATAGLWQMWLLEHARLTERAAGRGTLSMRTLAWGVLVLVVLSLVVAWSVSSQQSSTTPADLAPTVTLAE